MRKFYFMLLTVLVLFAATACGKKAEPEAEPEPMERVKLTDIAKDPEGFIAELDEYMRTGDIRMLKYFDFEKAEDEAGLRAILNDETGRELWCAAYAPTKWYIAMEDDNQTIAIGRKQPYWLYIDKVHNLITDCEPYNNTPEDMIRYFNAYAEEIQLDYRLDTYEVRDADFLINHSNFLNYYLFHVRLKKAVEDTTVPFTSLMNVYSFSSELPEELRITEQAQTEYYQLLIENRFQEAYEYALNSDIMDFERIGTFDDTWERYENMSDEQRANLQLLIDDIPKGALYQYSQIKNDKMILKGVVITYTPYYDGSFELLEEENPYYVKEIHEIYSGDSDVVSEYDFVGYRNVINKVWQE